MDPNISDESEDETMYDESRLKKILATRKDTSKWHVEIKILNIYILKNVFEV